MRPLFYKLKGEMMFQRENTYVGIVSTEREEEEERDVTRLQRAKGSLIFLTLSE